MIGLSTACAIVAAAITADARTAVTTVSGDVRTITTI
jgi:hypothetical protein